MRTRHYAPQTNGVVERFNQTLKYEHLYRLDIANGQHLVDEVEAYREVFNRVRPHESLGLTPPLGTYLADPV